MTLIQRCALTVQLHPSIAHIPGGALSTLPTRNTKQHRDTDHTIARSRSSPLHHTLLLPLSPILHDPATAIFAKRPPSSHPDRSIAFDFSTRLRSFLTSFTAHPLYSSCPTFIRISLDLLPPSSLTFGSRIANESNRDSYSTRTKGTTHE